jgi:Glucose / Sorbosone dehydrogenase
MRSAVRWLCILLCLRVAPAVAQTRIEDSRDDWEVRKGFALDIDTDGFVFPSAIAFVPNPGPGPKDPLYFVTELAGQVKVVTNDRSIYTFAEIGTTKRPPARGELPDDGGEHGLAGICLDPAHGYVFVTFVYDDAGGARRNNMARLQSKPNTFSLASEGEIQFTDIFKEHPSATSHQIGPCQVDGQTVFVSVGDGLTGIRSQSPRTVVGKILRMTLDGKPVSSNPMFVDDDVMKPENYIWAMGLRNPFGLRLVGKRLFAADNGNNVDRFLEIDRGVNYLWDGSDESIGTNALVLWAPSVCPVATDYSEPADTLFPEEYRGLFYQALGGKLVTEGPGLGGERSIVTLDYDMNARRMRRPPSPFIRFRGQGAQVPVALAFGPDGLYFASILPTSTGKSPIYKVSYAPGREHKYLIGESADPAVLIGEKFCRGCHRIGVRGGEAGPSLNQPELGARLLERLNSPDYEAKVAGVDSLTAEMFVTHADARRQVLAASGKDRVRLWVQNRIMEPRFDSPEATMPNLGLNAAQAAAITDYLLAESTTPPPTSFVARAKRAVSSRLPQSRYRYTVLAFALGLLVPLVTGLFRRKRKAGRG